MATTGADAPEPLLAAFREELDGDGPELERRRFLRHVAETAAGPLPPAGPGPHSGPSGRAASAVPVAEAVRLAVAVVEQFAVAELPGASTPGRSAVRRFAGRVRARVAVRGLRR